MALANRYMVSKFGFPVLGVCENQILGSELGARGAPTLPERDWVRPNNAPKVCLWEHFLTYEGIWVHNLGFFEPSLFTRVPLSPLRS